METLRKKPEILRDSDGRFERHGKELSKPAKKGEIKIQGENNLTNKGRGRPKGSKNKTTIQLKEAILRALEKVGGDEYLAKLAIENSSAFSSLLGKVLPTTLQASESGGGKVQIRFTRVIVHPDGHREVEGKSPKLIEQASHMLPSSTQDQPAPSDINDL